MSNFAAKNCNMTPILSSSDTICAPATAQGGAIAVVRISGPKAIAAAEALFSRKLAEAPSHKALYGELRNDTGESLDDVVLTLFRAPHSYTGEDSVEISTHGSSYIVGETLRLLQQHGCRMAEPGEFTQRAFLNGRMDLSQAEAVADVIASTNAATHRLAMSQMRGGITRQLAALRDQLLTLTSLLELELDFSDHEELEFADRTQLSELTEQLLDHVGRLADSFRAGQAIKNGIPVAIIGAPNVGKSTLLNALLHDERAIVSDIQGTTRDIIEDTMLIDGHTFRFIDTAGIRHTDDTIERLGIERSHQAAERAQIIILLTEPAVPYPALSPRDEQVVIRVMNKTDLSQASVAPTAEACCATATSLAGHSDQIIGISAKNGVGLDSLRQRLTAEAARLTATDADLIVTNARHHAALCAARESLERVAQALPMQFPADLIAQDLREVLFHLAEITGSEITSDEVLGNIFAHFCIGK